MSIRVKRAVTQGRAWRALCQYHERSHIVVVVTRHRRFRWRVSGEFGILRDVVASLTLDMRRHQRLVSAAAEAQEQFGDDELEQYAAGRRRV